MDQKSEQVKDPLIGMLFADRYRIERFMARSSMSVVYRAVDVSSNNAPVAVKLLNGVLVSDQDTMQRFHREAQIARSLMHPNVCALLDHGITAEGTPYHVLEYIDGQTLEDILGVLGALNPVEALSIFIKTCRAVHYLHTRGIVHRDLKPANLMVPNSEQLSVKVIDFGIAKGTRHGVHQSVELTKPGEIFGSLLYTPPERLIGQQADARSDVYSLGCLMYETLTGANPFQGDSPQKIVENQLKLNPEPLHKTGLNSAVSAFMQPIISKALDKVPARRYESAAELKDALEAVESHVKIAWVKSEELAKAQSKNRRRSNPLRDVAVAAAFLLLTVGLVYGTMQVVERLQKAGLTWVLEW